MKQLLRIAGAKALLLLSFNVYAQSDARSLDLVKEEKVSTRKKAKIAHAQPARRKKTSTVPDIRRELASASVSLYPNPVIDKLIVSVDLDQWQGGSIVIKNRAGRVIAQQRIYEASVGFNLRGVSRGVYFLSVRKAGREEIVEVIKM